MNIRLLVALSVVFAAPACIPGARVPKGTAPAPAVCAAGDTLLVRTDVFMGRNIPGGGEVSDSAWNVFVAEYVTPRFPDGFSVMDQVGQWRGASGVIERERSKVLTVHHYDTAAPARALDEIAIEYKRRFRQEAVLRARGPSCVRAY